MSAFSAAVIGALGVLVIAVVTVDGVVQAMVVRLTSQKAVPESEPGQWWHAAIYAQLNRPSMSSKPPDQMQGKRYFGCDESIQVHESGVADDGHECAFRHNMKNRVLSP
ncbi:hypothetical protein B0T11DRAFT_272129 [Plectosphaerella cucumerina]|uniref:Uncharacterized protein n=1 Tax=Plectosphaerella cucumerina TaxID=40658 RepID=A0A8K0TVV0_9PEZI|nr:hypothetical protein B0T11DRAFT_272129 [Plectosphaerella cucumerina]